HSGHPKVRGSTPDQESLRRKDLRVDALITATIEERKIMPYTQRGHASGKKGATALYLWVTGNNHTFSVGPVAVDNAAYWTLASNLLYSDCNLHLLQRRGNGECRVISLSRMTEELSAINSVLSNWSQKDVFFSSLSTPTAGLVAVLSNASASDDTWNDEYLCLNATVTNATKVKDGFQLTEPESRAIWLVNFPGDNVRHVSLSHNFTLVASVTIEEAPSGNTSLLTAMLADTESNHTIGLSYSHNKKWEAILKGETTTRSRPWVPKEECQMALMLQGNKASVHIDGQSLGEEEVPLTGEKPPDVLRLCFGACGGQESRLTVTNVFLYNRPLDSTAMRALKDGVPATTREAAPTPPEKIRVVDSVREHIAEDITEGK
ncbi:putative trans-sialidase, partial [Trypanosoma cruzi]